MTATGSNRRTVKLQTCAAALLLSAATVSGTTGSAVAGDAMTGTVAQHAVNLGEASTPPAVAAARPSAIKLFAAEAIGRTSVGKVQQTAAKPALAAAQPADEAAGEAASRPHRDKVQVATPVNKPAATRKSAPGAAAAKETTKTSACKRPGALGVKRTITLDPKTRYLYGNQQYRGMEPLLKDGEVVLTFDDGPLRRHTRAVLAALDKHCAKATFFTVGKMAIADPTPLREVAAAGHTIGHHSWSHLNQNRYSFERTIAEFELGVSAVEAVTGKPSAPFFRFPYLADPKRMRAYLKQRNFGIFSIDIDSYDWRSKSAPKVHATIMAGLKKRRKGILLFHDIQRATARALDGLLADIHASGFKIVHLVAAAPAETLPEYDAEAKIRLDKGNYRSRSRPIKTAFRFNGAVAERAAKRPRRKTAEANPEPAPRVTTAPAPAMRLPIVRSSETRPSSSNVDRPQPITQPRALPDWRRSLFGER